MMLIKQLKFFRKDISKIQIKFVFSELNFFFVDVVFNKFENEFYCYFYGSKLLKKKKKMK